MVFLLILSSTVNTIFIKFLGFLLKHGWIKFNINGSSFGNPIWSSCRDNMKSLADAFMDHIDMTKFKKIILTRQMTSLAKRTITLDLNNGLSSTQLEGFIYQFYKELVGYNNLGWRNPQIRFRRCFFVVLIIFLTIFKF